MMNSINSAFQSIRRKHWTFGGTDVKGYIVGRCPLNLRALTWRSTTVRRFVCTFGRLHWLHLCAASVTTGIRGNQGSRLHSGASLWKCGTGAEYAAGHLSYPAAQHSVQRACFLAVIDFSRSLVAFDIIWLYIVIFDKLQYNQKTV